MRNKKILQKAAKKSLSWLLILGMLVTLPETPGAISAAAAELETGTEETVHEKENEHTGKAAGSCLPLAADQLDLAKQYKQMMLIYEAGIRQLTTKLQILNREFEQSNDRNPIENIKSRIKSAESIAKKMERKGLPMTLSCLTNNIFDIAGIRVICPFITDVYEVARMLLSQTDVELVQVKDYIREPKENGYRSLHLIVKINVFLSLIHI